MSPVRSLIIMHNIPTELIPFLNCVLVMEEESSGRSLRYFAFGPNDDQDKSTELEASVALIIAHLSPDMIITLSKQLLLVLNEDKSTRVGFLVKEGIRDSRPGMKLENYMFYVDLCSATAQMERISFTSLVPVVENYVRKLYRLR